MTFFRMSVSKAKGKKLILLTVLTMLLTGCMNIKDTDTGIITTKKVKITYAKDGKTPVSKETTTTTEKKNKKLTNASYTIGTKGTGDYTLAKVSVQ